MRLEEKYWEFFSSLIVCMVKQKFIFRIYCHIFRLGMNVLKNSLKFYNFVLFQNFYTHFFVFGDTFPNTIYSPLY